MSNSQSRVAATEDGALVGAARSTEQAIARFAEGSRERVDAALTESRKYVTERPIQSVLIAAGVGALVGYMLGRRR